MKSLIRNNYFIAICAFAQTLATFFLFTELDKQHLYFAMAVLFGTQIIYTILRAGETVFHKAVFRSIVRQGIIPTFLVFSFLAMSEIHFYHGFMLIFSLLLCLLYGMHIFGERFKTFSLRKTGVVKLITIGLVWVIVTVLLPVSMIHSKITSDVILFSFSQFCFIILLTLPFDLFDSVRQEALGFQTVPRMVGDDISKKIGRFLCFLAWGFAGFFSFPAFLAMSVCVLIYLKFLNSDMSEWTFEQFTFKFDGLLIVQALLIAIFHYLI